MKHYEKLEQLAATKEAEAAAIRQTLAMLMTMERGSATKLIGGKMKAAIALRAEANGNGHTNGNGNGHAATSPSTRDRVAAFLNTQPAKRGKTADVAAACDTTYAAVASLCDRLPKEFKRVGHGIVGLASAMPKRTVSATQKKELAKRMKARWAEAKAAGKTLNGKKLQKAP